MLRTLSFRIRIGGGSGCETADQGEDVVVEYRTVRSSVFQQIITLAHDGEQYVAFLADQIQPIICT